MADLQADQTLQTVPWHLHFLPLQGNRFVQHFQLDLPLHRLRQHLELQSFPSGQQNLVGPVTHKVKSQMLP